MRRLLNAYGSKGGVLQLETKSQAETKGSFCGATCCFGRSCGHRCMLVVAISSSTPAADRCPFLRCGMSCMYRLGGQPVNRRRLAVQPTAVWIQCRLSIFLVQQMCCIVLTSISLLFHASCMLLTGLCSPMAAFCWLVQAMIDMCSVRHLANQLLTRKCLLPCSDCLAHL
jgi:hypothetical protein